MTKSQYWQIQTYSPLDKQFVIDWEYLSNTYHPKNQFLGIELLTELLTHFRQNTIYIARAFEEKQLKCMMLLTRRRKLIWEIYKPSQAQVALLLIDSTFLPDLNALVQALPMATARIDFLSLDPAEHTALLNVLESRQLTFSAKNMQIRVEESFENYWRTRSKNLRKNISRYENRLVKENVALSFRQVSSPEEILSAVDRYGMLEARGWKGKSGTALHPSNTQGQFYRSLLHQLAKQKEAIVYEFYIQDRVVASRLCCLKQDMLIILKTTFDENYKSYALGRLLLKKILSSLFETKQVRIIDFYTNASPEQLEWATEQRHMYNASMYANNLTGLLLSSVARLKRWLKVYANDNHNDERAN